MKSDERECDTRYIRTFNTVNCQTRFISFISQTKVYLQNIKRVTIQPFRNLFYRFSFYERNFSALRKFAQNVSEDER